MVQKYPSRSPNYGPNIHNLNILVPYLCHLFGPNIFKFTEFHIPNSGDVSDGFKFRSEILVISRTFLRSQFWVMAVPVEARSTDKAIPCQSRGHTLAKFWQSQGNPCIIPIPLANRRQPLGNPHLPPIPKASPKAIQRQSHGDPPIAQHSQGDPLTIPP